ncbi:MAG: mannitol dehydrogenase family protein [Treponema sp.]|jgi:mannitol-1-phosphate/altronate dehydrogenase|nr:mannitol dehydrogenase family protein [Treponema sp.]
MERLLLNQANLEKIGGRLKVPGYDRGSLPARMVHVGLGHFHRAHQAAYIDALLNRGRLGAGIFAVNLVKDSYPLEEIARSQDYLYTLAARGGDGGEELRVIGSILGYLNASGDPEKAISLLASAETRVISLTVTEKGYHFDMARGDLAWDSGPLQRDLRNPREPETMPAFLSAALEKRRRDRAGPVTVMSCDNFPSNGRILKTAVLSFCKRAYPDLVPWIEENAAFPLSMVDRITPATSPSLLHYLQEKYGVEDRWAVGCEDFCQWVLEDRLAAGAASGGGAEKPDGDFAASLKALAEEGAGIVKDVEPYELMKIRLLNGSHSALSYPAFLLGYTGVAEALGDPLIRRFIRDRYMEEVSATLPPVPGMDLDSYKDTLIKRFSNRNIGDTVLRLASDGSKKIPNSVLEPLAELVRAGKARDSLIFALAAWARFLSGSDERGRPIPLDDPNGGPLREAAKSAGENAEGFLKAANMPELPEGEPGRLAERFGAYLDLIYRKGTRGALEEFLDGKAAEPVF